MSLQRRYQRPESPAPPSTGPRLLTLKDAARYLGVHLWAVRQFVRKKEIPYLRIGRAYMIDRMDLDRYIERNKVGVAA